MEQLPWCILNRATPIASMHSGQAFPIWPSLQSMPQDPIWSPISEAQFYGKPFLYLIPIYRYVQIFEHICKSFEHIFKSFAHISKSFEDISKCWHLQISANELKISTHHLDISLNHLKICANAHINYDNHLWICLRHWL